MVVHKPTSNSNHPVLLLVPGSLRFEEFHEESSTIPAQEIHFRIQYLSDNLLCLLYQVTISGQPANVEDLDLLFQCGKL